MRPFFLNKLSANRNFQYKEELTNIQDYSKKKIELIFTFTAVFGLYLTRRLRTLTTKVQKNLLLI